MRSSVESGLFVLSEKAKVRLHTGFIFFITLQRNTEDEYLQKDEKGATKTFYCLSLTTVDKAYVNTIMIFYKIFMTLTKHRKHLHPCHFHARQELY